MPRLVIAEIISVPTIWFGMRSTHLQTLFQRIWERNPDAKKEQNTGTTGEQDRGIQNERDTSMSVSTEAATNSDTSNSDENPFRSTKEGDLEAQHAEKTQREI